MGIWVRSQDGTGLFECRRILFIGIKFRVINQVLYQSETDDYDTLGEYDSKEESLAVLDEIENLLMPKMIIEDIGIVEPGDLIPMKMIKPLKIAPLPVSGVYQMPPKGFLQKVEAQKLEKEKAASKT